MDAKQATKVSKFISLILRHKPESVGITLDKNGWANVNELIDGVKNNGYSWFNFNCLVDIVQNDEKQRYSFNKEKTLIRANQGHSVNVDVELEKVTKLPRLFHGTSSRFIDSIYKEGLKTMNRNYVQLSPNIETAEAVGKRHGGNLVIFEINTDEMIKDGYDFYKSVNGVYLTKSVPVKYLEKIRW